MNTISRFPDESPAVTIEIYVSENTPGNFFIELPSLFPCTISSLRLYKIYIKFLFFNCFAVMFNASTIGVLASRSVASCLVIITISLSFIFKVLPKSFDSETLSGVSFKSFTSFLASRSDSALSMPFFFVPS